MYHQTALWLSLTSMALIMHFTGLWDFRQQDHRSQQDRTRCVSGNTPVVWELDWSSWRGECWLGLFRGSEALPLDIGVPPGAIQMSQGGRWQKWKL